KNTGRSCGYADLTISAISSAKRMRPFQIPAIAIIAPVRQRTEKLMNQIAMCPVNFADIESRLDAANCRIAPGFEHLADIGYRHRDRCRRTWTRIWNGTCRQPEPRFEAARRVTVIKRLKVSPEQVARRLSARMAQLNA
ncbi:MAG: hypothetical protein WA720_14330, partial [Pseudolabrys sp.]